MTWRSKEDWETLQKIRRRWLFVWFDYQYWQIPRIYLQCQRQKQHCTKLSLAPACHQHTCIGGIWKQAALIKMRRLANNTKAKKRAASSHNKLNKLAKQQSSDDQLQRHSSVSTKPKHKLLLAIKDTKESLKALETIHLPQLLADVDQTSDEKSRQCTMRSESHGLWMDV